MQPPSQQSSRLSFWKQWLLHWLGFWGTLALVDYSKGLYGRVMHGADFYTAVGATWSQAWPKLLNYNEALYAALFLLAVEFLYHFVFRRQSLKVFLLGVPVVAIIFLLLLTALTSLRIGKIAPFHPAGLAIFMPYAIGYAFVRDGFYRRSRQNELRAEQSETALTALRAQLNPHFFFNTLNTLYGTALQENAQRTAECIEQLAGLMRYTLSEAQQEMVTVAQEVQFLEDYLHLQRLRLPLRPNIDVRTTINFDGQPAVIAPLLLLPFLENAFTYGISIDQDCFLHLTLQIENNLLTLSLENRTLPGRDQRPGAGTGLRHVRQRLALLYPHRHELTVGEEVGRFSVKLLIHLEKEPSRLKTPPLTVDESLA